MPGSTASYTVQEGGQRTAQGTAIVALGKLMTSELFPLLPRLSNGDNSTDLTGALRGSQLNRTHGVFSTQCAGSYETLDSDLLSAVILKTLSI